MNREHNASTNITTTRPEAAPNFPPQRVVERKIGRATFLVASRMGEGKEKDLVSTLARLIQHDSAGQDR